MKVLVTGINGFIGKNLSIQLKNEDFEVLPVEKDTPIDVLDEYTKEAEFVFHLAGVNRPKNEDEFMEGNVNFTKTLISLLEKNKNFVPIMLSSSAQAVLDNPYGKSKLEGEKEVTNYGKRHNINTFVYRFPGVYGKWSKPNYNTVVATFCYNIARNLPISVSNPKHEIELVYIDDVVHSLVGLLKNKIDYDEVNGICYVKETDTVSLERLSQLIYSFKESRENLSLPNLSIPFEKNLYSTYLSFLPTDDFAYPLITHHDDRGSFTEFIRTPDRGQVSVNISKPGITKGNHWHHTKNEKFLVVSGRGVIRFKDMQDEDASVIEYFVSGEKLEVVDIPVGYTHNIENLGTTDMVTVMWVNESFDPQNADTYYEEL